MWAGAAGHSVDHIKLAALEMQLWGTLSSFARWAVDVPAALSSFGETLGAAFQRRPDLQAAVCNVLRRICGDTCAALRAFGVEDGAGFGDAAEEGGGDAATSVFAVRVGAGPEEVPGTFTEEMALGNRDAVRGVAQKWLTELLNRYVKLAPEGRGAVGEAVVAVAAVAGEAMAGPFFKEALSKVIASLQAIQVRCSYSRAQLTAIRMQIFTLALPLRHSSQHRLDSTIANKSSGRLLSSSEVGVAGTWYWSHLTAGAAVVEGAQVWLDASRVCRLDWWPLDCSAGGE